jgi:hypothetical protein
MSDNLPNELNPAPTPFKRPNGLTFICILTFIFSGLSFISSLFYSLYYNFLPGLINSSPFTKSIQGIEGMTEALKTLTQANIWFFILNTIFYGISLGGAIMMFKLKKVGFHFYTVAQILLLITPLYYLAGYKTDIANTFITGIFILIYATNLRIMK